MTATQFVKKYYLQLKKSGDKWQNYLWFYPNDVKGLIDGLKYGFTIEYDTEDGYSGYYDDITQSVTSWGIALVFRHAWGDNYTVEGKYSKELTETLKKLFGGKNGYFHARKFQDIIDYVDDLYFATE